MIQDFRYPIVSPYHLGRDDADKFDMSDTRGSQLNNS